MNNKHSYLINENMKIPSKRSFYFIYLFYSIQALQNAKKTENVTKVFKNIFLKQNINFHSIKSIMV